jgi:hypothetical protein
MNMVETVAKAIFNASVQNSGRNILWHDAGWPAERVREEARACARAAIAAMREPTQDMIDAADDLNGSALFYKHYATCQDHWAAMIDTALHGPVPATADPIGFDLPQGERE